MIELAGSAAHVVVDDLAAPGLDDIDTHHLGRVLRLRAGETVTVTDGRGGWRECVWNGRTVEPCSEVRRSDPEQPPIAVAFALLKGDRLEWVVQKLTELGIDRLIPLRTDREVVRWDEAKVPAQMTRLARIVRDAVMQSRRVWMPIIETPVRASELLAHPGVARADLGGDDLEDLPRIGTIAVGPEGGWSDPERQASGAVVGLGATVLRAETAAISAGVLLADRRRRSHRMENRRHAE